ncbi:MAG: hypothetical protein M1608_07475 [Candidatus Omnitrophica bacterium]|nr:hypothetical protein [Candidatus Omnitrophota bacterium]
MNDQVKARAAVLKHLREQHRESVARTQAWLREQMRIQQQIRQAIREQPRTVPEVARAIGLAGHEVLWHITALRKYGEVVETGMRGAYYLYQTTKEAAS